MPKRIQRKRMRGWKMPPNTVYVGRPSTWGNPYLVRDKADDAEVIGAIMNYLFDIMQFSPERLDEFLAPLRGHDLACWCALDAPCHADVLLRLANNRMNPTSATNL